jgi:hypothetical protein
VRLSPRPGLAVGESRQTTWWISPSWKIDPRIRGKTLHEGTILHVVLPLVADSMVTPGLVEAHEMDGTYVALPPAFGAAAVTTRGMERAE